MKIGGGLSAEMSGLTLSNVGPICPRPFCARTAPNEPQLGLISAGFRRTSTARPSLFVGCFALLLLRVCFRLSRADLRAHACPSRAHLRFNINDEYCKHLCVLDARYVESFTLNTVVLDTVPRYYSSSPAVYHGVDTTPQLSFQ